MEKCPSFKVSTIKYCLIFQTKSISNTRNYVAKCKISTTLIPTYTFHKTQTVNKIYIKSTITHNTCNLHKNSYAQCLHCLLSSEILQEVTSNPFSKLIRTIIPTKTSESCLKNKLKLRILQNGAVIKTCRCYALDFLSMANLSLFLTNYHKRLIGLVGYVTALHIVVSQFQSSNGHYNL